MTAALRLILKERAHQKRMGYDDYHDNIHKDGVLEQAACAYALDDKNLYPWDNSRWKSDNRMRRLVRGAATMLAALEREIRMNSIVDDKFQPDLPVDLIDSLVRHARSLQKKSAELTGPNCHNCLDDEVSFIEEILNAHGLTLKHSTCVGCGILTRNGHCINLGCSLCDEF